MIKLVQRQPEYRFDVNFWNGDLADDRPLDECGWHVRRHIKKIIERWRIQPEPERDSKGTIKRGYDDPYWNAWRDMFMRNAFQPKDIEVLFDTVRFSGVYHDCSQWALTIAASNMSIAPSWLMSTFGS